MKVMNLIADLHISIVRRDIVASSGEQGGVSDHTLGDPSFRFFFLQLCFVPGLLLICGGTCTL